MTPDQILELIKVLIPFIEWIVEHRTQNGHVAIGPVRRRWLEHELAGIEASKSQLTPKQLAEVQPVLDRLRSLLSEE